MRKLLKLMVRSALARTGYELARAGTRTVPPLPPDFDEESSKAIQRVLPYTMTSPERLFGLRKAIEYITRFDISGDVVECGVWRGGSMMLVANTLRELQDTSRNLFLFDTYSGMPAPTEADEDYAGTPASERLAAGGRESPVWAVAELEHVKRNLRMTGYPAHRINLVKGMVEETIPEQAPDRIALLRLDTDWYASTRHELEHLIPRITPFGVVIIDDYGHWKGARKAVDEWLSELSIPILLNRLDYTGRICTIPKY